MNSIKCTETNYLARSWLRKKSSTVQELGDALIIENLHRLPIVQSLVIRLNRVDIVFCIRNPASCLFQNYVQVNGIPKELKKRVQAVFIESITIGVHILTVVRA
jgi:hypothetical protein